jgi:hypothetical protein
VFSYQRKKVSLCLALADVVLVILAFEIAYQTRVHLALERSFFLSPHRKAVLLLVTVLAWLAAAASAKLYEHLDSAQWARIVRSTLRQCFIGTACLVLFEYFARWDFYG